MIEWFILIFVLTIIYFIMKNPKTPTEKPTPNTNTEQAVVAVASEAKAKKSISTPKTPKPASKAKPAPPVNEVVAEKSPQKTSPAPKAPKKSKAVTPKSDVSATEITPSERVGLTAGSIWHYLADNGATSVAKLISELPEEEKIVQRSIGWLAQEDKITLDSVDRVEIVSLK